MNKILLALNERIFLYATLQATQREDAEKFFRSVICVEDVAGKRRNTLLFILQH
jgi:uncharacterized lipoprotein YehR (DUF1307 family)